MGWLNELFVGNGVAHAIFIYSLVIALGVILGKTKVAGVSLGVTFVLFMGILAGHFGLTVDSGIIKFIQEFGSVTELYLRQGSEAA